MSQGARGRWVPVSAFLLLVLGAWPLEAASTMLRSHLGSIAAAARGADALDSYAATVDELPGGPPLAHWRLGEASGQLLDRKAGARHATVSGTVVYGAAGLPQDSDDAVDFATTGYAERAHDAGLALSAFSLSLWFRLHNFPSTSEGENRELLVSKDEPGLNAGDFSAIIESDGSLTIQFQDASTQYQVPIRPSLSLNTAHHLVVRADSSGFDAYLDGAYLGKVTAFTDAWGSNAQALRFAAVSWALTQGGSWPADAILLNGILDEIALYARVITEAEVLELAQYDQVPIATPDTRQVPEGVTSALDVVANDQYAGQKANLTLEVSAEPVSTWGSSVVATHGTATVRGDKDIDFAAGSADADEADAFNYRISDSFGTSAPALVSLTIQDTPPPSEGDDGHGGTLVYHWEPLASWIDGVPLSERDSDDIAINGTSALHWWQDGANPANGGARIGHDLPLNLQWVPTHACCFNRAPTGHPAFECLARTSHNAVMNYELRLFPGFGTNPRHLRIVLEMKHSVPSDPTTHKSAGLSPSGPYQDFHDSFLGHHAGKYYGGLFGGNNAQGGCATNWWNNASLPRNRGYYAASLGSSGNIKQYAYYYSRPVGPCGRQIDHDPPIVTTQTDFDGKWNRLEYESKLQDPSLANSSWAGTAQPTGGDGFIKMYATKDIDGTPSARIQFSHDPGLVFFTSENSWHITAALGGMFMNHFHGGSAVPLSPYHLWLRKIQVYRYTEDDI